MIRKSTPLGLLMALLSSDEVKIRLLAFESYVPVEAGGTVGCRMVRGISLRVALRLVSPLCYRVFGSENTDKSYGFPLTVQVHLYLMME
jgi:hypothetical protein